MSDIQIIIIGAGAMAAAVLGISKLYGSVRMYIKFKTERIRDWFNEPTKSELIILKTEFKDKDYRDCQTDILNFLTDVENKARVTEVQVEHMCKIFKHYCKNLEGNTYVETEWKRVFPMIKGGVDSNEQCK